MFQWLRNLLVKFLQWLLGHIKVRMGDIIWLEIEKDAEREKLYKTQIWGKHVDFLLCNKRTLQPLLAVELDDEGHRQFDRREVDEFKSKAFAIAKLPLLRVKAQKTYLRRELREQIIGRMDEKNNSIFAFPPISPAIPQALRDLWAGRRRASSQLVFPNRRKSI